MDGNWIEVEGVLVHKDDPNTRIHTIPAQPGHTPEHYIVYLRGAWILERRRRIKMFASLDEAKQAGEGTK